MTVKAAPIPRVARDRRDDRYDAGRPSPGKRAGAGWVVSVEGDTCTVMLFEEEVSGVIYLGEEPTPGSVAEVEARGDLLVVRTWYAHPVPPPEWLVLPDVVRTMVPAGYTTPQGTNGWAPGGSEFGLHSQRLSIYILNGPVFNPIATFDDASAWACLYPHGFRAEQASLYYNTPPTSSSWSGSATCPSPTGPVLVGAQATSGVNGASSRIATAASGGQDYIKIECRATACWISLSQIKTSHLGHISSPSGGLPDPVPPPGYTLVWENPTSALTKIAWRRSLWPRRPDRLVDELVRGQRRTWRLDRARLLRRRGPVGGCHVGDQRDGAYMAALRERLHPRPHTDAHRDASPRCPPDDAA
jgi:hypothetical protein